MKDGWQFVLNETSVEFLMSCRKSDREMLLTALRQIAEDPAQTGDFVARDKVGRRLEIKLTRRFLITFWADHFVKELRVINIESR